MPNSGLELETPYDKLAYSGTGDNLIIDPSAAVEEEPPNEAASPI